MRTRRDRNPLRTIRFRKGLMQVNQFRRARGKGRTPGRRGPPRGSSNGGGNFPLMPGRSLGSFPSRNKLTLVRCRSCPPAANGEAMADDINERESNQLAAETFAPMMMEAFHDGLREIGSLSRWLLATLVDADRSQVERICRTSAQNASNSS